MIRWITDIEEIDKIVKDDPIGFCENDCFGIFVDDETGEWLGSANIDFYTDKSGKKKAYIFNIESNKKGNGKKMIEFLLKDMDVQMITGDATQESKGFWEKMGAVFEGYADDNGWTPFVICK